jgi:hypothetical protein
MVVGGDLNLTLPLREVWGAFPLSRPTWRFLCILFLEKYHLADMEPIKLVPTWRNFHTNEEAVAKRLDRFMVSEAL